MKNLIIGMFMMTIQQVGTAVVEIKDGECWANKDYIGESGRLYHDIYYKIIEPVRYYKSKLIIEQVNINGGRVYVIMHKDLIIAEMERIECLDKEKAPETIPFAIPNKN